MADARSGFGLDQDTAGAAGTGAVASSGGVEVGVDRVVRGISFYASKQITSPPLLTRVWERK